MDKIAILEIKSERISDLAKLTDIHSELNFLRSVSSPPSFDQKKLNHYYADLKHVNEILCTLKMIFAVASRGVTLVFGSLSRRAPLTNTMTSGIGSRKQSISL